jgi:hypothetical protein
MKLEEQLADSQTISSKVKSSEVYAQNLYAALCNMQWRTNDPNTGLFAVTWRTAGGIVANLRGNGGSYLDWYCSGIGKTKLTEDHNGVFRTEVSEGTVTKEIEQDMLDLGWKKAYYSDMHL